MSESASILEAWTQAVENPVYVVCRPEWQVYVETPDEQALSQSEPEEGLVRVFLNEEEAVLYLIALETYNETEFRVLELRLRDLMPFAQRFADPHMDYPMRFELAEASASEWPRRIDTIWTAYAMIH